MPYPPQLVQPMRDELVRLGVEELMDAESVDRFLSDADGKTAVVIVNSVCGCAAGSCRPSRSVMSQSCNFSGSDIFERISSEKQCCEIRHRSVRASSALFTG